MVFFWSYCIHKVLHAVLDTEARGENVVRDKGRAKSLHRLKFWIGCISFWGGLSVRIQCPLLKRDENRFEEPCSEVQYTVTFGNTFRMCEYFFFYRGAWLVTYS